jgi:hypothetical protein
MADSESCANDDAGSTDDLSRTPEGESAQRQMMLPRTNSMLSAVGEDVPPPYSLIAPEGERYTNYAATDEAQTLSTARDDDFASAGSMSRNFRLAEADHAAETSAQTETSYDVNHVHVTGMPSAFESDVWHRLRPLSFSNMAIDVMNDGRAHIDGKLHLQLVGYYSGQLWRFEPVPEGYWKLTTMYLGSNMVLTATTRNSPSKDQYVRLAPWEQSPLQMWYVADYNDGSCILSPGPSTSEPRYLGTDSRSNRLVMANSCVDVGTTLECRWLIEEAHHMS